MRTAIFTMAMLAACNPWDSTGLGYDDETGAGSEAGSSETTDFMPDSKRPVADDGSSSSDADTTSGSGAEVGSDESSSDSSSGDSSTGDMPPPQPCSYEDCSDVSDCGDAPSDRCAGFSGGMVCSRTCDVEADCDPRPDWALTYPACMDGYCYLPCLDDLDCGEGQVCHPGSPGRCTWPH